MRTIVLFLGFLATAQSFPAATLNSCDSNLGCNNHGTCTGNIDEGLYCICDPGFYGLNCELPDPCDNMINCNGHGVCAGGADDFHCECNAGWYGVRCQIPMDTLNTGVPAK